MGDWEKLEFWDNQVKAALADQDFDLAFKNLVLGYQDAIVGYCKNMLDDNTYTDAAQEVFLAARRGLPFFLGKSLIRTWLFSIARHLCLKELENNIRHKRIIADNKTTIAEVIHHTTEVSVEDIFVVIEHDQKRNQLIEQLPQYLKRLEYRERDLLMLYYYAGFSFAQISKKLRIPQTTVRRQFKVALQHLKELMSREVVE